MHNTFAMVELHTNKIMLSINTMYKKNSLVVKLEVTEVPVSFRIGVLTSGDVPDDISDSRLEMPNIEDQIKVTTGEKLFKGVPHR